VCKYEGCTIPYCRTSQDCPVWAPECYTYNATCWMPDT
jgi:hypothetical protein